MADDPDRDLIPIRDITSSVLSPNIAKSEGSEVYTYERSNYGERKISDHVSRNDLQDDLHRLRNENFELKKTSRSQEDQLKKLATKMSRLVNEKRKNDIISSPDRKRDIELEEALEDLHDKVRVLEKSNVHLREKLLVAKQQVITHARRPNAYHYVHAKTNTNRPRSGVSPHSRSAHFQGTFHQHAHHQTQSMSSLPPYVMQLLDEARNELFHMKELVSSQKVELDTYEHEAEVLQERLKIKDIEFEEELNILKSQITEGQRHHVQENLDLIRLHRELKQKNSEIVSVQTQSTQTEEKLKAQKVTQDRLVKELEERTAHLRDEQKKSLEIFAELQKTKGALSHLADLQESLKALKKENEVLKDTNDQLIKSVLHQEKEKTTQSIEQTFGEKIAKLEYHLSKEDQAKDSLQDEINREKRKYQELSENHKELQSRYSEAVTKLAELESKMNILKSNEVDLDELGKALALMNLKKQEAVSVSILGDGQIDETSDLISKLKKSERDHTDTIRELCNVREMLVTQYKLHKDSQDEIRALTDKNAQNEKEYQLKLEEYAHLLDVRALKIEKLEKQLHDIAYGTKKFKISDVELDEENTRIVELNRGENIFEIHISKFVFSNDGLTFMGNNSISSFITWSFYEFEIQSTPVVRGTKPQISHSAQYLVKIDDFFLFYIHKNTMKMELHESIGMDFRTVAACQINFSEVLEQSKGRLFGSQQMYGVNDDTKNILFGTVHFWVRMQIPMQEAFKLYKQKFKALKYTENNQISSLTMADQLKRHAETDNPLNELHIRILRCRGLRARHKDVQPSPFCIYQFHDLPQQDTAIIPASNNPEFHDFRTFKLPVNLDLENYLSTQNLAVFVFDDNDPDISFYIGKASVCLLPLSQDKEIKGRFELQKDDQTNYGSIEMELYWKSAFKSCHYLPLPQHVEKRIEYPSNISPVIPAALSEDIGDVSDSGFLEWISTPVPLAPKPLRRTSITKPVASPSILPPSCKKVSSGSSSASSADSNEITAYNHAPNAPCPAVRFSKLKSDEDINITNRYLPEKPDQVASSVLPDKFENESRECTVETEKNLLKAEADEFDDSETTSESDCAITQYNENLLHQQSEAVPKIVIGIFELSLEPGAPVLEDPKVKMLYVEYRFLDFPLEEMETPSSLQKPVRPATINFDYMKAFELDLHKDIDRFKLLCDMFNPNVPEASWLKFSVVSEPPSDQDELDCEEIGAAYVDLKKIIQENKDISKEFIKIFDAKDNSTEIGQLEVTVEALRILQMLN